METINKILDIDEHSFNIEHDVIIENETTDFFTKFLTDYSDFAKEQLDISDLNQLNEYLQLLEKKYCKYEDTIQNIIPPLTQYMTNLNTKLSEYTTELNLIKDKSDELKTIYNYNSRKLANISPVVNDLLIPPQVAREIILGKVNSSWIDHIAFIKDKQAMYSKYMHNNIKESNNTTPVILPTDFKKLCEVLKILKTVILERSKKFLISRIRILRSCNPIPSQRVQNQLLRLKNMFKFIIENNISLALEIRQAYAYTMRWYYKEYFSRYIRSLTILQFTPIDNQYALGHIVNNSNISTSLFSTYLSNSYGYSSAVSNDAIKEYFQINKRLSILTQEDNTVMVSQIAENNKNTKNNFIEIGFKNLNLAILDNCTVEFNFLKDFFQISDNVEEINGILEQIFHPTFEQALTYIEQILINPNIFDIFGVLISIRIGQKLQLESLKRSIPSFVDYLNDQLMMLWPKFQQLIDWQSESLNNLSVTTLNLEDIDLLSQPHELTISFTLFLESLLTLSIDDSCAINYYFSNKEDADIDYKDNCTDPEKNTNNNSRFDPKAEPLYQSIIRIRNDYETVMTKFSKITKSAEKFLSINYLYLYNSLQQQNNLSAHTIDNEILYNKSKNVNKLSVLQEIELHFETLVKAYTKNS